jgi:4-hydroxy-2-oxoheptanedioate aldolase
MPRTPVPAEKEEPVTVTAHPAAQVIKRAKDKQPTFGFWSVLDTPAANERIARLGYDYVCLDAQHGLMGYSGILQNLMAIDAGHGAAGVVRVEGNDSVAIGRALDAGARGVIVPLVNNAEEARAAVRAARYPRATGTGQRSYGPMRSGLRIGPTPAEADDAVLVLVMVETAEALANLDEICAVEDLDGIYVGPYDLSLALGGRYPLDPAVQETLDGALTCAVAAAQAAGKIAGIHTLDAGTARQRAQQGFTFVTVATDLVELENAAANQLAQARA